jgi:hypothetical protein
VGGWKVSPPHRRLAPVSVQAAIVVAEHACRPVCGWRIAGIYRRPVIGWLPPDGIANRR